MKGRPPSKRRRKGNTARLAARLAPLEEMERSKTAEQIPEASRDHQSENHHGAIVVDNKSLNLPEDILEDRGGGKFMGMEPVVLVILGVMLAFIAFIAWQVSQMPPP